MVAEVLNDNQCPVCLEVGQQVAARGGLNDFYDYNCIRCGNFRLTDDARLILVSLQDQYIENVRANISGWLREHAGWSITSYELENLRVLKKPSVSEKALKFLREIDKRCSVVGERIHIDYDDKSWWTVSWSSSGTEVYYLLNDYLTVSQELLIGEVNVGFYRVSPDGYAHLQKVRETNEDSQIGFCAMWFNDSVTRLWSEGISKAIENARYEPKRIDKHQHNNKIDDEIIAMIRRSRFVVADFTGQRGGVYFEAGFALGLNIPVIWTCRADELKNVHFDNRQYNFVVWKIEELPAFIESLQNRIEATLGRGRYVKSNQISNTGP